MLSHSQRKVDIYKHPFESSLSPNLPVVVGWGSRQPGILCVESGPWMEEKGPCPPRKPLPGQEVVGSPYSASSVPCTQGRQDGGEEQAPCVPSVLDWARGSMSGNRGHRELIQSRPWSEGVWAVGVATPLHGPPLINHQFLFQSQCRGRSPSGRRKWWRSCRTRRPTTPVRGRGVPGEVGSRMPPLPLGRRAADPPHGCQRFGCRASSLPHAPHSPAARPGGGPLPGPTPSQIPPG